MDTPDYSDPSYEMMFANYGLTSLAATCLEKTVMLILIAASRVADLNTPAPALYKAMNENNKRTLGNLISLLKKNIDLPESFETNLDLALSKRNYLIHHFFFEHLSELQTPAGAQTMSDELRPIRDLFSVAQEQVDAAPGLILKTRKLDLGALDQEASAAIRNEGAG
jgi:hypothetical protein